MKPEKSIPDSILKQAKGLAIITVANVGMMVTYKIGTGLVIARRDDGSWSAPSAVSTFGIGWGAQVNVYIFCYYFFFLHLWSSWPVYKNK
jgi:SH3 domain-containing YSC84-like protein 1